MDVRLIALKQEQNEAFCRAMAAGFDNSNMCDLLDFSEHFGADRLREACIHFIHLLRKRNTANELSERMEVPSIDAVSSDSDMSLESCTESELPANTGKSGKDEKTAFGKCSSSRTRSRWGPPERIQMNHLDSEMHDPDSYLRKSEKKYQPGNYSHQDDTMHSDVAPMGRHGGSGLDVNWQNEKDKKGGMFFNTLHKMAQQVEARRLSEGVEAQFNSDVPSHETSDGAAMHPESLEKMLSPIHLSRERISPMVEETVKSDNLLSAGRNPMSYPHTNNFTSVAGAKDGKGHVDRPNKPMLDSGNLKDSQEEPASNSSRRLSVQAAISLFESKKEATGEAPARKLVRQDSQKRAARDGSSSTEKAVLRRWSGGSVSNLDKNQDGAYEVSEKAPEENLTMTENVGQKMETGSELDGRSIQRTHTLGTENVSATQNILSKPAVHLNEASSKENLSTQQHLLEDGSSKVPGEALHKKSRQESNTIIAKSPSSYSETNEIAPSVPVLETSTIKGSIINTGSMGPEQGKETLRHPVGMKAVGKQVDCGTPEKYMVTEQKKLLPGSSGKTDVIQKGLPSSKDISDDLYKEKLKPDSQTIMRGSLDSVETSKKLLAHNKQNVDDSSVDNQHTGQLHNRAYKSRPSENEFVMEDFVRSDRSSSSILHEAPFDLNMQALVMMIDNHHQSSNKVSDNEDSIRQFRGRFYDCYSRLRHARQRCENPLKRAEKEAKLRLMREIFNTRKAEMEAVFSRQVKNVYSIGEQKGISHHISRSDTSITLQEKKEMGEEEMINQPDIPSILPSHQQIMYARLQAGKEAQLNSQINSSTSQNIATTFSLSSSRTIQASEMGLGLTSKQYKVAPSVMTDIPLYRSVLANSKKDLNISPPGWTGNLVQPTEKMVESPRFETHSVATMAATSHSEIALVPDGYHYEDASNAERSSCHTQVAKLTGVEKFKTNQMTSEVISHNQNSAPGLADKPLESSYCDSADSPSLLQECPMTRFSDASASPAYSFEENSGATMFANSPKVSISLYSPSRSPVSWIRSKTKRTPEHERHSDTQACKESVRGFRRLLKFGRNKSRTSESMSTDGVSVSTTSEGDDGTEEFNETTRQACDDFRLKSRVNGPHMTSKKVSIDFQNQGSPMIIFPNHPVNKLKEDNIPRSTSSKESRSFFSSFRNRGTEGKSR
ncbi:hypothetical protein KP509_17G077700 [Ceratopteris richardii]|nr:hypothetical protein KP509_17G077700 [Ceratopteris richardii]KAH7373863.1 hypothetical protein KP509_17G077700 [Ceratopteris richardii]